MAPTPAPLGMTLTILDVWPSLVVEGMTMTVLPLALNAPLMKSGIPPGFDMDSRPVLSASTWPVRSITDAVFMATILLFLAMTVMSFV